MQNTHIWHQFHLYGKKVVFSLLLLFLLVPQIKAQHYNKTENLPNYDNRWLHYGFLIGIHSSSLRMQYSDAFVSDELDSLHSIMAPNSFGFSLGLIANVRLADYLDLRLLPEVVFYENRMEYNTVSGAQTRIDRQLIESTFVEFPILLKYKSVRRGNSRMYLVGGIEPGIEATGKKDEAEGEKLSIKGSNLSLQLGFGMDIYFPLFKFSPEIRFSRGLVNALSSESNRYSQPIDRLVTNTVTLYLLFE